MGEDKFANSGDGSIKLVGLGAGLVDIRRKRRDRMNYAYHLARGLGFNSYEAARLGGWSDANIIKLVGERADGKGTDIKNMVKVKRHE